MIIFSFFSNLDFFSVFKLFSVSTQSSYIQSDETCRLDTRYSVAHGLPPGHLNFLAHKSGTIRVLIESMIQRKSIKLNF